MLEYLKFDENGVKTLCEMGGKNADMLMTIRIKEFKEGESLSLLDSENETAFLILKGDAQISWQKNTEHITRRDCFDRKPFCLHVPRNIKVDIVAKEGTQILIQQTDNERDFAPVFYKPEDILYQHFGEGQYDGTAYRICSTVFDYDNAPYSNMVLGEVFNQPGRWSSYPPHHHPQPEVYYYQFDKEQGFGACFLGDDVYKSSHGSASFITDGNDHQQVVAPGYEMCYVWMIRHLPDDTWYKTSRFYAPEHEWLAK